MREGKVLSIPQPFNLGSCMSLLPAEGLASRESFQEAGKPGLQSCCIAVGDVVEWVLPPMGSHAEKSSPLCNHGGVELRREVRCWNQNESHEACSLISSISRQLAAPVAALLDNDGAGSQECILAA